MPQKTKTQLAKLLLTNTPPVAQHTVWIIAILNTYRLLIIIAPLCLSPVYHEWVRFIAIRTSTRHYALDNGCHILHILDGRNLLHSGGKGTVP